MKIHFNPAVICAQRFNMPNMERIQRANLAQLECDTVSFTGSTEIPKRKKSVMDLKDSELAGKNVLVRVDFNVPVKDDKVSDDTRIRAALPTIEYLTSKGAKVILTSHFEDKAGDKAVPRSLNIVAERLEEISGLKVQFCPETTGEKAKRMVGNLNPGEILMLENTRFDKREKKNDDAFSAELADLADVYVNDAFGTAHRAHSSTEGVAKIMAQRGKPAVLGLLMEKEVGNLGKIINNPERPLTVIIGGKKVSDKVEIVDNLLNNTLQRGDNMIIGGAMAFAFSKADSGKIGTSFCPDDAPELAKEIMQNAKEKGINLIIPSDVVVADDFSGGGEIKIAGLKNIPDGFMGLDAGPETQKKCTDVISNSKTILWNGPVGVFENDKFDEGTRALAQAVAEATKNGATTVVGGGDSVTAINKFKLPQDAFTHVSTGGGASMKFLEGIELPGVAALDNV